MSLTLLLAASKSLYFLVAGVVMNMLRKLADQVSFFVIAGITVLMFFLIARQLT
jgi:hypothetical protein